MAIREMKMIHDEVGIVRLALLGPSVSVEMYGGHGIGIQLPQQNVFPFKELYAVCSLVYLRHKVKELLTNIALGMVMNTLWTSDYEATDGYIIVKDDGGVECYHIYNQNAFSNHMLANTQVKASMVLVQSMKRTGSIS